jgi:hypothetical protein
MGRNTAESVSDAWDIARMYRCKDCQRPAQVLLMARRNIVTRVHHPWCSTWAYITLNHPTLRRPVYSEDIRKSAK